MVNIKAGKTISLFSIFYGILSVFSNILGNQFLGDILSIFRMIISIGLIVVGIISIKRINKRERSKGLVISMLVFYILMSIVYFLSLDMSYAGIIMFLVEVGILMIPITSGFKYLSSLKKVSETIDNHDGDSVFFN